MASFLRSEFTGRQHPFAVQSGKGIRRFVWAASQPTVLHEL